MKTRKATSNLVRETKIHRVDKPYAPRICPVCKGRGTVWNISMDRFIQCTYCDEGLVE